MQRLKIGILGLGMIFEETYAPCLQALMDQALSVRGAGLIEVELVAVGSLTGKRWPALCQRFPWLQRVKHYQGESAHEALLSHELDLICIATPDHCHFAPALQALKAGVHVLLEKPSVLALDQCDQLCEASEANRALAKVVYHKLFDPDHQRLRTLVHDQVLRHVNVGYCTLLEPKHISRSQFAPWIRGRNPATYVGIHYIKLIHFTFFQNSEARLSWVQAEGQRGQVGDAEGPTWDAVQLRMGYTYPDGREAIFDIHTSWVHPDNAPGYVDQEVQFRFDNGVWNADQRRRGVEVTVEDADPKCFKSTPNHHYNADLLAPHGQRSRRGYGLEVIRQAFQEAAYLQYGGPVSQKEQRFQELSALSYNDLRADRPCVGVVQALEAILDYHAQGQPHGFVWVNHPQGGLVLGFPGKQDLIPLYEPNV